MAGVAGSWAGVGRAREFHGLWLVCGDTEPRWSWGLLASLPSKQPLQPGPGPGSAIALEPGSHSRTGHWTATSESGDNSDQLVRGDYKGDLMVITQ